VPGYGLDDRVIEVRSPVEARDFSSNFCVKTVPGAHPTSCTMGTGGPFPGGKARPVRHTDHSSHLVPRLRMSRSYTSSPPASPKVCCGTALLFNLNHMMDLFFVSDMILKKYIYCNKFAGSIHNGSLLQWKLNTQLLITVHNSSRILTHVWQILELQPILLLSSSFSTGCLIQIPNYNQ
jgi:hypothetical protein